MIDKIKEAVSFIEEKVDHNPDIGLILGSGLGVLAEDIENKVELENKDIPNFPISTVEGHAGQLVIGNLEGRKVVTMQGRFHYYEGYDMSFITFPVRFQVGVWFLPCRWPILSQRHQGPAWHQPVIT